MNKILKQVKKDNIEDSIIYINEIQKVNIKKDSLYERNKLDSHNNEDCKFVENS